eukprot:COSAG02_NODE_929_length_15840_cov_55.918493_10_plen_92_part_00
MLPRYYHGKPQHQCYERRECRVLQFFTPLRLEFRRRTVRPAEVLGRRMVEDHEDCGRIAVSGAERMPSTPVHNPACHTGTTSTILLVLPVL